MFQKNKTSGKKKTLHINNLPDKEFKEIVKILKRPTRMDEHSKLQQREYISIEQKVQS